LLCPPGLTELFISLLIKSADIIPDKIASLSESRGYLAISY